MLDVVRHAQVQFSIALGVLLICLAALAVRNLFGRPPAPDLVLPRRLRELELPEAWRARGRLVLDGGLVLIAVVLAVLALGSGRTGAIDRSRVLHEHIQAKYHAELGWEHLYACAWAADRDGERALAVEKLRELSVEPAPVLEPAIEPEYRIDFSGERPRKVAVPVERAPREPVPPDVGGKLRPSSVAAREADCRERFDDARWSALATDMAALAAMAPDDSLAFAFEGFGSTASPGRLARQRLVTAIVPISGGSLFTLGLLGGLLSIAAMVAVGWAYGVRAGALVAIVCFVEFARSPIAAGATVTEPLLLALLLGGLAAAELERWAVAGALLAFAAVDLVWPSLLLVALLAKFGVEWLEGRPRKRELGRFALAAAVTAGVMLLLTATLPGGLSNWSSWADRVAVQRYADGSHQVGLRWLFVPDGSWLGGPAEVAYPQKAQRLVDRADWLLLCGVLLIAPALLAARRLPAVAFASLAGVTVLFSLFSVDASNYGLALPLFALAAAAVAKHHEPSTLLCGRPTTVLLAGTLALCVGMHGMVRIHVFGPWLFNMIYSHLLTTLLLGLGVALLLLPGLREHGDPPGAPPSVPVREPGGQP